MLSDYTDIDFYRLLTVIVISKQFIITAIFVILTVVIMTAYRKVLQRVELDFSMENMNLKASVTLLIPVFLLLTLLVYSYILLSSPITVSFEGGDISTASAGVPPPQSTAPFSIPDQNIRDLSLVISELTSQQNRQVGDQESRELLARLSRWRNSLVFSRFPEPEVSAVIRGESLPDEGRESAVNFLMGN